MLDVLNGFAGYHYTTRDAYGCHGFVKTFAGDTVVSVKNCSSRSEAERELRRRLDVRLGRERVAALGIETE